MNEEPRHIGEQPCMLRQKLEWTSIPEKEIFAFEIINWKKIQNIKWRSSNTYYCRFAARVIKGVKDLCDPGDTLIMDVPYRTFARMLDHLPLSKKRFLANTQLIDNVYMKIIKISKQSFKILELERRTENLEMTMTANKILYHTPEEEEENETNKQLE